MMETKTNGGPMRATLLSLLLGLSAISAKAAPSFFGITNLHRVEITMLPDEWRDLQSSVGGRGGRGGGGGLGSATLSSLLNDPDREIHVGSGFGGLFPWVHASVAIDGQLLSNVGMRYKGNSTFSASEGMLRRSYKLKFDQFDEALRFDGLKTLNLNSGALDSSRIRETLSFSVFRAAGVPAAQTAFAEATLTVPGSHEREHVGLYTLIEQVNKQFLKRYFTNNDGLLLKPERLRGGIQYLGENWSAYEPSYRPEREATPAEARRVIDFAQLIATSSDAQFREQIGSFLEVDRFLRFVAVNAILMNLDSYLSVGHNFFIYLDPSTSRFVFIPWDQDLSMGGFGGAGGGQGMDASLMHPYSGQNELISRLLDAPEFNARYRAILTELSETACSKAELLGTIGLIEQTIRAPLEKEAQVMAARQESPRGFGGRGGGGGLGRGRSNGIRN